MALVKYVELIKTLITLISFNRNPWHQGFKNKTSWHTIGFEIFTLWTRQPGLNQS